MNWKGSHVENRIIVVVDSDWNFRNQIISLFRNRKIDVLGFDSGDYALEFIRDTHLHPDLTILDTELLMGRLSGIEVAHELRDKCGILTPILFLSSEPTLDIWPQHIPNSRALSKRSSLRKIFKEITGHGSEPPLITL